MTKEREKQDSGGAGRGKDEEIKTEIGMQGRERFRDVGMRRGVVRRVVGVLRCRVGVGGESDQVVRTIEWRGREVARGRRAVDPAALGGDAEG